MLSTHQNKSSLTFLFVCLFWGWGDVRFVTVPCPWFKDREQYITWIQQRSKVCADSPLRLVQQMGLGLHSKTEAGECTLYPWITKKILKWPYLQHFICDIVNKSAVTKILISKELYVNLVLGVLIQPVSNNCQTTTIEKRGKKTVEYSSLSLLYCWDNPKSIIISRLLKDPV